MQLRQRHQFTTIRTEGSILPADLLQRINEREAGLAGLKPDDYHLPGNLKLNEAINQSWNRLLGAWTAFRSALMKLLDTDPATTLTREKWLLPAFNELGYGRLLTARAIEIDGGSYPVSHGWQHAPLHLVGAGVDLDRRTAGVAGAARMSPHGLVQELLNRSDAHVWGMVSNGLRLRILRDNVSLTRQAYVEFDLEAMMNGELYADFALFWLLCHESRVHAEKPQDCWLEKWSKAAQDQGTRALEQLRRGVEEAIEALGRGFLAHASNHTLVTRLRTGTLSTQDYYRQLLRLVYRLLFLFVAEDRDLLLRPDADAQVRQRYERFYSLSRLRLLAEKRVGTRHADLYHGLRLVMAKLGSDAGCPELALPALGSFLFSRQAIPDLEACDIANAYLLDAVRALAFINDRHGRRLVDYKNLRSEELGSVYEALLELLPDVHIEALQFDLKTVSGSERKSTGSYYTPESLVQCLLDSALEPVVAEALKQPDTAQAILRLKVCDPACGSGHFLIAAAHRLAKHLASVRTGDDEPAPESVRTALRDVIGHCIYGVDINPMAVELCKVSLWMEALEPGKPLSFLDHRIQCGNSLIGATPALLKDGIPDDAFKPIEGDDRSVCSEYRKHNKQEREGQQRLFAHAPEPWARLGNLTTGLLQLEEISDASIAGVRHKQERWEQLVRSQGYIYSRLWADAWCAALIWRKIKDRSHPYPITEDLFRKIERNPFHIVNTSHEQEIHRLAEHYQFFHWHLAFPDVFRVPIGDEEPENEQTGWRGGFDVVLGNPPWGASFDSGALHFLRINLHDVVSRMVDSYIYFFRHALALSKRDGIVALIVSATVLNQVDTQPLRNVLLCRGVRAAYNFGQGLFSSQVLNTSAVLVSGTQSDDSRILLGNADDEVSQSRLLQQNAVKSVAWSRWKSLVQSDPHHTFFVDQIPSVELLSRLRSNCQPFSQLIRGSIQRGVSPDIANAHVVSYEAVMEHSLEHELLRPSISGSQVKPFHSWYSDQFLIYTTRDTDIEKYPHVYHYLSQFRSQNKCKEVSSGKHPWWALHRPRDIEIFQSPKFIGLMTTKAIEVIFDETQSLSVTDAMYVFHIHEDFDPWAILGLIHSNIFLFLYKVSNQGDARVIPQVKASKLSTIPVPTRAFFSSTARKLADCTQKLCSITRDIANLPSQTIGSKTTDLEGEIYQLTVEMNMLVSSLYELDDKDESLVNLSLQGLQRS